MDCLIFTGGKSPEPNTIGNLLTEDPFIIAADSGLDFCIRNNIDPHLILGDFDSLSKRSLLDQFPQGIISSFPEDKDYTDTELAVNAAADRGFCSVGIIGGGEGRGDHFLALVELFKRWDFLKIWVTARERIYKISGSAVIKGKVDGLISFFPLSSRPSVEFCQGVKWSLCGLDWQKMPFSLSNRFTQNTLEVSMEQGELLVFQSL